MFGRGICKNCLASKQWVITEIRTNTIETRMNKENCILYIKEAEKLIGKRFH